MSYTVAEFNAYYSVDTSTTIAGRKASYATISRNTGYTPYELHRMNADDFRAAYDLSCEVWDAEAAAAVLPV